MLRGIAEHVAGAEVMEILRKFLNPALAFVGAAVLSMGLASSAYAQIGQYGGASGPELGAGQHAPPIETSNEIDLRQQMRSQAEHALILGDWLVSPSAFAGGIYDTNPAQASTGAKSSEGLRLTMSGLAERNTGISKTDLYGMADGRVYTNGSATSSNIATAQFGGIETYSPVPDWTFNGQGDFTRQRDLFDTFGVNHSVTTLNTTGVGLAPSTTPQVYNQVTGAGSAEKQFGSAFVDFGGSAVAQFFDQTSASGAPDNAVYTATTRGGVWMTPDVYGFVEGSGDSRNFDASGLSSDGYRAVAGLGTGRVGLMQGEVYAGYQEEMFRAAALGTARGLAFGGQLDYSPLPELDLKLGTDRTIGVAQTTATSGNSTTVTDVLGIASYAIAPEWSASGRAGYIHTDYKGTNRVDNSWTAGPTLTYSIWQNFGLTLDYQHIETTSNAPFQSFSRDVVTAGVSYKY
ncbi:MAG TPA: outer membrane beta-barrel protein [Alphaproteobacteria bacterium]|nr:outer membrane beta-barrel protein [Alphaproteobacteria bacterium]